MIINKIQVIPEETKNTQKSVPKSFAPLEKMSERKWYEIGDYSQWVKEENGVLTYSCTCKFASSWMFTQRNRARKAICKHLKEAIEQYRKTKN